jgi:hypothetical protein
MNRRLGIDSMGTDGGQDEKGSRGYVPLAAMLAGK